MSLGFILSWCYGFIGTYSVTGVQADMLWPKRINGRP